MMIFHDSRSGVYRLPSGAVACGESVAIRIRAVGVCSVVLRVWWNDAETLHEMEPISQDLYACELTMPEKPGVLWYYFRIVDNEARV